MQVHVDLEKWAQEYGSVMSVQLGTHNAVVLTGYDIIKEAMIDKAEWFSERPAWLNSIRLLNRQSGMFLYYRPIHQEMVTF